MPLAAALLYLPTIVRLIIVRLTLMPDLPLLVCRTHAGSDGPGHPRASLGGRALFLGRPT
jgi:hypothetical protein